MKFTALLTVLILCAWAASFAAIDHSAYVDPYLYKECVKCHPRALPTHKLTKPRNMTENWPLDPEGRMVCITCHDCLSGSCVLRKKSPELCKNCHDCTRGMSCLIGIAHMGDSPDIDMLINDCMACHDGTSAKSAGGPGEHRVDVLYIKKKGFNTVTDRRIVFIDGKVTCVSCHNPYATDSARLSFSNTESRLCLVCHIK